MSFNFIEDGHFYEDQHNNKISLNYLKNIPIHNGNDSLFALFIDNYNAKDKLLNSFKLKCDYEVMLGKDVHVYYEGDMSRYYSAALQIFDSNDLVLSKYNRGGKTKLELDVNGVKISLAEVKPTFKISCVMLSFIWSLYRLGHFDGKTGNIVTTVIDERYKAVEEKVMMLFDYVSNNSGLNYKDSLKYIYYRDDV